MWGGGTRQRRGTQRTAQLAKHDDVSEFREARYRNLLCIAPVEVTTKLSYTLDSKGKAL